MDNNKLNQVSDNFMMYQKKFSLEAIEEIDFFDGLWEEIEEHIEKHKEEINKVLEDN
ncbi:hypothetical protein DEFDS_1509 [Deferribacter desulfuricans SSM1]|uniref:Uncharacterized protein n=1 Tax=Deferribacter desulfuricans (strain DSM 14783 / JCM 11476 / NBRC 101012 / SSM1) TaxID=639282 RepID=D3PEE6_DEFDS|nr:hypothetical protein [Deferribacter desulfuricans]BAI80969.1 hypothetical protein DEFDS_1509 [Deferribacter desulfuricans SSM1]